MPDKFDFTVNLEPQPEGGFTVTVPALPEVATEGETETEALSPWLRTQSALSSHIGAIMASQFPKTLLRGCTESLLRHEPAPAKRHRPPSDTSTGVSRLHRGSGYRELPHFGSP